MINKEFRNSNVGGKNALEFFERFYKNHRTLGDNIGMSYYKVVIIMCI